MWDLPPTFCSLVQRAGRAARDMSTLGVAFLMVRQGTRRQGVKALEVDRLQSQIFGLEEVPSSSEELDEDDRMEIENAVETSGHEIRRLDDGGRRVERAGEGERDEAVEGSNGPKARKKKTRTRIEEKEATYLTLYANTTHCLREVWDEYFGNKNKSKSYHSRFLYAD